MSGGFQAWKGAGLEFETPVVLSAEQKNRYSRHLLIPEVGSAGQAKAARFEGAAHRGGWPRVAGGALSRGGGCRDDRHRRLRHRRPEQPPAPDHPHDRSDRGAQGRVREALDQRTQPRDQRGRPRGDARRRERRSDHRGLRRHPRWDRHLRDALHPQRRGGGGRHPGHPRVGLPVRRAAHDVHPVRGPVLSLPVSDAAAA